MAVLSTEWFGIFQNLHIKQTEHIHRKPNHMDICDKFFLKIQVDSAKVPNTPAPEKGKVEERNGASL